MVKVDGHLFQRVLQNLLQNALHHAAHKIAVHYEAREDCFCLMIDDDGPGIPEQEREAIFAPFARLDSSRNRESGGFGLGLAIVFQIALWHDGGVTVSDSPLGGARFSFTWPQQKKMS